MPSHPPLFSTASVAPAGVTGATLYFDCASGASGDMLAAALLALCASSAARTAQGAGQSVATSLAEPLARIVAPALAAVGIDPAVAHAEAALRGGLSAVRFAVDDRPGFETFAELIATVRRGALAGALADGVVAVAERLAAAERAVHGGDGEHLHELASLDTAVDLISVLALVAELAPARVMASPPVLGSGTVHTAHGELSVPAPAVIELLRGLPTGGAGAQDGELTTPTGAALLAHLADGFGRLPAGRLGATGLGAGRRELAGRPNVLRALLVEPPDRAPGHDAGPWSEDDVELLETTIDDLPAELLAEAAERLLAAGALDVWSTPATMKKSRPGTVLHVLARPAAAGRARRDRLPRDHHLRPARAARAAAAARRASCDRRGRRRSGGRASRLSRRPAGHRFARVRGLPPGGGPRRAAGQRPLRRGAGRRPGPGRRGGAGRRRGLTPQFRTL